MIKITVDDRELRKALAAFPEEIKRASRNALNDLTRQIQKEYRTTLPGKFAIEKRVFVDRQVYIGPGDLATKDSLRTRLSIQGPGGQQSTLAKFEDGGQKRPVRSAHLAIPAKDIRAAGGHVLPQYRFKNFMPLVELSGTFTKLRRKGGKFVAGKTLNLGKRTIGQRGSFLINLKSGQTALAQRPRGAGSLKVLYVFQTQTPIPVSLAFERDAMASAERNWQKHMSLAIEHALKRTGLRE